MVEFSLNTKEYTADGYVIRRGKIFQAGEYPDKKISISPEELLAASSDFRPAPLNLEHITTPFDGKLGTLSSINVSKDGTELFGEIKLRKCVDEALGDDPLKVSCEWSRSDKKITGLALTTKPRVKDAVLMSAFSEALVEDGYEPAKAIQESLVCFSDDSSDTTKTWSGQYFFQSLHDMCGDKGAVCDPSKKADFVSKEESTGIQKLHDLALENGAKCRFQQDSKYAYYNENAVSNGAENKMDNKEQGLVEILKAFFSGNTEADGKEKAPVATVVPAVDVEKIVADKLAELEAKFSQKQAEIEAQLAVEKEAKDKIAADLAKIEAEKAAFSEAEAKAKIEGIKQSAIDKVDTLVKEQKVLPANRAKLEVLFSTLALDDVNNVDEKVSFSENGTVYESRVDLLTSFFSEKVDLKTVETMKAGNAFLSNEGTVTEKEEDPDVAAARAFAKNSTNGLFSAKE